MATRSWQRDLDAKAATVTVRCNRCDHEAAVLETNVGVWKVAHMHQFHPSQPESFSLRQTIADVEKDPR